MAISKDQKKGLVQGYGKDLSSASNVVILKQSGIPVNESNALRIGLDNVGGKINIVRKRLFLRSLADAGYETVEHKTLDGAIVALYSTSDEYAPLKEVQKYIKSLKKADKKYGFEYVGGRFEKEWKDAAYVGALATLPSKEELVGKFLFLLKHPVQKLVGTLDAIAKKDGSAATAATTPAASSETPASEEAATTEAAPESAPEGNTQETNVEQQA